MLNLWVVDFKIFCSQHKEVISNQFHLFFHFLICTLSPWGFNLKDKVSFLLAIRYDKNIFGITLPFPLSLEKNSITGLSVWYM